MGKIKPFLVTFAVCVVVIIICFRLVPASLQNTLFGGGLTPTTG